MTAAALAEVATIMMLSLLFSATSKTSAGRRTSLAMFLALLAVIALALGRVRNLAFLDRLEDRSAQLRVRAALALALAFAVLVGRFGFASILGAFAAGLLVRTIDLTGRALHPQFQTKLEGIGFGFLVPVFFITTGVQFDAGPDRHRHRADQPDHRRRTARRRTAIRRALPSRRAQAPHSPHTRGCRRAGCRYQRRYRAGG